MILDAILRSVEKALGQPSESLTAHLCKLLVYEKGGFFLPHRDGEKLDRMVATLVISLPSKHTGGELIVRHGGREVVIPMQGAATGLESEFAAFYADCEHEVKPVQSGYRLCLTYNLVLKKSKHKSTSKALDLTSSADQLVNVLSQWSHASSADESSASKLAVLLDHKYSEAGLTVDALKGVDLAQAMALFDAAQRADCDAYLALITLWQSGAAEGGYDDYGYGSRYGRRRSYSSRDDDDEDDDEEDEGGGSEHEMEEIYDSSLEASHFLDRTGKKVAFGRISLGEKEIVATTDLTDATPDREDFEGYTGNAGMTLERWYHRAAIVLWPRSQRFKVWCDAGTDAAVAGLNSMVAELTKVAASKNSSAVDPSVELCRQFAATIIGSWKGTYSSITCGPDDEDEDDDDNVKPKVPHRSAILQSLTKLGDSELVCRVIQEVMPNDASLKVASAVLTWMSNQGWSKFAKCLTSLTSASKKETIARNAELLRQIATLPKPTDERQSLCREMTAILMAAIERLDAKELKDWDAPRMQRTDVLIDWTCAMFAIGHDAMLSRLLAWQSIHPRYDIAEIQIPAITKLASMLKNDAKSFSPFRNWIDEVKKELRTRTQAAPQKPTNWKRDSKLNCDCADCMRLSAFLADPTQPEARFPLAKARRSHLHNIIDRNQCDCTHTTLRVGSPQVLVCKKTYGRFESACKTYEQELKLLGSLEKIK